MKRAKSLRPQLFFVVLALAWSCVQPPPDVAGLRPLCEADTRVVRLLREADRDSERDPHGAARTIREFALPAARDNARASADVHPQHARARALASDLRSMLDERVVRLERYAAALDSGDPAAQLRETRSQRELEDDLVRLDGRVRAAEREPATRGCGR